MYHEASIGVVVPCHNEELLITRVLDTMPDYVDCIYVVDDVSSDNTVQVVEDYIRTKGTSHVHLIKHPGNRGVGGAIVSGYKQAVQDGMDVMAVMAGDAQMDPEDLHLIIEPVTDGHADYTKGNRLASGEAWYQIPRVRYIGNVVLSLMTKVASGYWHIFDSQTGYTAISRKAIETIPLDNLWERYGYPNHLLIMLNIYNFTVADVPVKPVYNIGEKSGIRLWRVMPSISLLLLRGFIQPPVFQICGAGRASTGAVLPGWHVDVHPRTDLRAVSGVLPDVQGQRGGDIGAVRHVPGDVRAELFDVRAVVRYGCE